MKNFLKKAAYDYYNGIDSGISDEYFDALADKYGFDEVGTEDGEVEHFSRMYSLKKVWVGETTKEQTFPNTSVIVSVKLDGASLSLVYEDGFLISAVTRGNGIKGKSCLHNIMVHPDIPKMIPYLHKIQITGELVLPKELKNSRNQAAGSLGLKDSDEFVSRKTTFIAYGIFPAMEPLYSQDMILLRNCGFDTVIDSNWNEFPQDGTVWRIDSNEEFEKAGYTDRFPRGSVALKDRADEEVKETILREVKFQVGKGGKVVPLCIFDPIELDGATITRATLHNVGYVEDLDLEIGKYVFIRRAGSIIPQCIGSENVGVLERYK